MKKLKIGDRIHYENAVDWFEGIITNVETRKTNPHKCEECGTKLSKGGKKYIHYDIKIEKSKMENPLNKFIGELDTPWLKDTRFIKFYKLPPV